MEGDIDHGSLMAGQSVGFVEREESIQEIMDLLVHQATGFLSQKIAC
jgi:enoyl-[acyl-carrier protein] reductase II